MSDSQAAHSSTAGVEQAEAEGRAQFGGVAGLGTGSSPWLASWRQLRLITTVPMSTASRPARHQQASSPWCGDRGPGDDPPTRTTMMRLASRITSVAVEAIAGFSRAWRENTIVVAVLDTSPPSRPSSGAP